MVCEILQPKVSRCENRLPLRNGFAASQRPLRKFSQLRRGLLAHKCHFAAKYSRFAAAKWLRTFHALRSTVSQSRRHFEGCFAVAKPPFGTRVPFRSPPYTHFVAAKWLQTFHALKILHFTPFPPFSQLQDIFPSLPEIHFMHTICRFEDREVRSPMLQTACELELK